MPSFPSCGGYTEVLTTQNQLNGMPRGISAMVTHTVAREGIHTQAHPLPGKPRSMKKIGSICPNAGKNLLVVSQFGSAASHATVPVSRKVPMHRSLQHAGTSVSPPLSSLPGPRLTPHLVPLRTVLLPQSPPTPFRTDF